MEHFVEQVERVPFRCMRRQGTVALPLPTAVPQLRGCNGDVGARGARGRKGGKGKERNEGWEEAALLD